MHDSTLQVWLALRQTGNPQRIKCCAVTVTHTILHSILHIQSHHHPGETPPVLLENWIHEKCMCVPSNLLSTSVNLP
jgi:hypothetical protein